MFVISWINSTRKFEYPGDTIEPTDRLGAAALTTDMNLKLYDYPASMWGKPWNARAIPVGRRKTGRLARSSQELNRFEIVSLIIKSAYRKRSDLLLVHFWVTSSRGSPVTAVWSGNQSDFGAWITKRQPWSFEIRCGNMGGNGRINSYVATSTSKGWNQ